MVVESQGRTLRVYGPDGTHRFSMGGQGDGPGEFQFVDLAGAGPDGFHAFDLGAGRVTRFDAEGAYVGVVTFQQDPPDRVMRLHRLEDGTYLGQSRWRTGAVGLPAFADAVLHVLDSLVLRRLDPTGETLDTVAVRRASHSLRISIQTGGQARAIVGTQPFGATTQIVAHSDGGATLLLGPALELVRYGPTGEIRMIVRAPSEPEGLDPAELDRMRQRSLDGDVPAALREALERLYAEENLPERRPVAGALHTDRDGNYWVGRYEPLPTEITDWVVFAPTGELLGTVTLPLGFTVHEIGRDWILGVARDELDVQSVRRYALVPAS